MHFDTVKAVPGHLLGGVARLDIFNPHPPFPTSSSFGTLVGGAYLMTSYLNKHFNIPVCCGLLSAKQTYKPECLPCSKKHVEG